MTIHLESELVATGFDDINQVCIYTIERDGRRWTARIPVDELRKHKTNKMARRTHVANVLMTAMLGKPDPMPSKVEAEEVDHA